MNKIYYYSDTVFKAFISFCFMGAALRYMAQPTFHEVEGISYLLHFSAFIMAWVSFKEFLVVKGVKNVLSSLLLFFLAATFQFNSILALSRSAFPQMNEEIYPYLSMIMLLSICYIGFPVKEEGFETSGRE